MNIGDYVKTRISVEIFKVVDIIPTTRGDFAVLIMSSGCAFDTVLVSELTPVENVKVVTMEYWVES